MKNSKNEAELKLNRDLKLKSYRDLVNKYLSLDQETLKFFKKPLVVHEDYLIDYMSIND
jgi:hypothetical protein